MPYISATSSEYQLYRGQKTSQYFLAPFVFLCRHQFISTTHRWAVLKTWSIYGERVFNIEDFLDIGNGFTPQAIKRTGNFLTFVKTPSIYFSCLSLSLIYEKASLRLRQNAQHTRENNFSDCAFLLTEASPRVAQAGAEMNDLFVFFYLSSHNLDNG